jgi:hypothetical protein
VRTRIDDAVGWVDDLEHAVFDVELVRRWPARHPPAATDP